MESAVVNARIPQAKRDLGLSVLNNIGATTTELINGAFDYLIENEALPQGQRTRPRDAKAFEQFVKRTTLHIDWGQNAESVDYKGMLEQELRAHYEAID